MKPTLLPTLLSTTAKVEIISKFVYISFSNILNITTFYWILEMVILNVYPFNIMTTLFACLAIMLGVDD